MDIITAIRTRKSIRAFLPKPVPQAVVREILETALRAPSAINTQPWKLSVVTGEVLEQIRRGNMERIKANAVIEENPAYTGVYRQRRVELGKQLFRLMGIEREDRQKRSEWSQRGFRYFDAPVAILISADKTLLRDTWARNDIGALAQTICLAALNYGLGTCIEAQGMAFPDVVRNSIGLPEETELVSCIALGYPDMDFPANHIVTDRAPVDEVTGWFGFAEGESV